MRSGSIESTAEELEQRICVNFEHRRVEDGPRVASLGFGYSSLQRKTRWTAEETQYAASRTCTYLPSHVPITAQFSPLFPIRRLSHIIFFFQIHFHFSSFPKCISLSILNKSFFST
ncbi:hypothetical protein VNO80_02167 [Phaseolus coccineus]|uniref:Uncharacterized protein n=1 Tax=Phaseolus coccineus TaxID=3886 RepID=A0AAN9NPS0_PHACN